MCAPKDPPVSSLCMSLIIPSCSGTPACLFMFVVSPCISQDPVSTVNKHPKPRSSTQHKFVSGSSDNSVQPFDGQTPMGRFWDLGSSHLHALPSPHPQSLPASQRRGQSEIHSCCVCGGGLQGQHHHIWNSVTWLPSLQGRLKMESS